MLKTPLKDNNSNFNSLKEQIEVKLRSESKKSFKNQYSSKNYQSHKKDKFEYFPKNFNNISLQQQSQSQQIQSSYENKNESNGHKKLHITEENILQYQSLQNPHFFGYQQWLQFNQKFFPHVQYEIINSFWKIIRIINYGDVLIPSGLIFQISKCLSKTPKPNNSLKQIFNQFLDFNKKPDKIHSFKEIKMYPSLEQIQNQYKSIKVQQKQNRIYSSMKKSKSLFSSNKKQKLSDKKEQQTNVFQRIYNDSKVRKTQRNKQICRVLISQLSKECNFEPRIKEYIHENLFKDSTLRPERICHQKQKWKTKNQQIQEFSETKNFKASEFDRTIFLKQQLQQIPGVTQYLSRKKFSEAQKRKIQRYLQKPTHVFRHA